MRVHRLTLRDYRGVRSCELTFAERGITVVEGDNESGKSSAAEALHLLMEYRDDSTHKKVMVVKPLHLDAGAEVEAEISVGSLRFTYAKRWHRDRFTRLRITSPRAEVVTGRDAHDRVRALLGGTVDLELWRALSAPQAEGLHQAALRDHPSLVAALDAVAGGELGTPEESDLLGRAEAEAARWFTPLGKAKGNLVELRRRSAAAATAVTAHETAIAALDADVSWCADLERRAGDLSPKLVTATHAAEAASEHAAELRARHAAVEGLALSADLAGSRAELAHNAAGRRNALVEGVAQATLDVAPAQGELGTASAAMEAAKLAVAEAAIAASAARAGSAAAGDAAGQAEADDARVRDAATLAQVARQLGEVELLLGNAARLQQELAETEAALAARQSTPAALAGVQEAHDDALRAEAALAAGRASVLIEALRDVSITVDGAEEHLSAATITERAVADSLVLELAGELRVTIAAGAAAGELEARHRAATALVAERCDALGVTDLAGARTLEDERRALVSLVQARHTAVAAALGGRTLAHLTELAVQAREVLAAGGLPRPTAPLGAEVLETARRRWDEARAAQRSAQRSADLATARSDTAQVTALAAIAGLEQAEAVLRAARAEVDRRALVLAAARAETSDDALEGAVLSAEDEAASTLRAWQVAAAEVAGSALEHAEQAAQRTTVERDGIARSLAQLREDLVAIRSRLELQGEGGLHDRLADAQRLASAIDAELTSVESKAAAARLLLTTLTRHRDEAARAYGEPLQVQLELLGRLVFGATFVVELDDELRIAARILDGVPVPWSELSVGVKEQLAVLTRLAAATIVSPNGGVPVVFDDVLGFTDPGRLALMSAAFEAAAEHCQIIVLTCDPARYRHLARALTHCLSAPREVGTRQAG